MTRRESSVVIAIGRRGVDNRIGSLHDEGRYVVRVVTVTEFRMGVTKRCEVHTQSNDQAVEDFDRLLIRFEVRNVKRPIATAATDIIPDFRTADTMLNDLHDVYFAATAGTEELPVLTANADHFERIDDVRVVG